MAFPGKIIRDFPPSKTNQRNSEGSFIRLGDGSIAFAFSRYRAGTHDGSICDLAVTFSYDEGESFCDERIFLRPEDCGAMNLMSVSLLTLKDGSVGVFYLKKHKGLQCHLFMRTTTDFITFSDEIRCIAESGYYVVNNDRVRRLSDGRIVFAAAYSCTDGNVTGADHDNEHKGFIWPESTVRVYFSSDEGRTWEWNVETRMPHAVLLQGTDYYPDSALQEPGIEELDDGSLYLYYRTGALRQYQSVSTDGGKSFTVPEPSRFTSPPSPMSTRRLKNGDIVVGYNPAPLYFGREQTVDGVWTGGRTPYVLEIADGNMNRKAKPRAIETDEKKGFCYCAMLETKDGILLGYCAGGGEDKGGCLVRLRIRKILTDELYGQE